jgi:bilirubin oxidase
MVDFQLISREKGRKALQAYEAPALKDVAVLGPNERVKVLVTFAPYPGLYMFHCHNLVHEDHAMMAAFNVSELQHLGYNGADLDLINPLEPKWRAKNISDADFTALQSDVLPAFAATGAYRNVTAIKAQLSVYWVNHPGGGDSLFLAEGGGLLYQSALCSLSAVLFNL